MERLLLIGASCLVALVASGCGARSAATAPPATPSLAASTPTPTVAPPPPLAVIQSGASIQAVDAGGSVQWMLSQSDVKNLLPAASNANVNAQTAGPNVILSTLPACSATPASLVVLSRTGQLIGRGSFEQNTQDCQAGAVGGPTGAEWAWSVDDGSGPSASERHGRIVVAGLGVPEHTVYSWVSPPMATTEIVAAWTDMGIVMERVSAGGCGIGFHLDYASFLIDPAAGTLTPLFVNGERYGDARHNVRVSFAGLSSSAVLVNGTTFNETGTVATATYVRPDGAKVGVQRYSKGGCAGGSPTLNTEIIDVPSGSHMDIAGCGINGWFDSTHFVCSAFDDPSQKLETIDGGAGATLGKGTFAGVV